MPRDPIPYGGQPAFPHGPVPVEWFPDGQTRRLAQGLTVRDHFAAQALSGLLAAMHETSERESDEKPSAVVCTLDFGTTGGPQCYLWPSPREHARLAYQLADAMLAERERKDDSE